MRNSNKNCFSELFWYLSTKNTKNVASNAERCALWFRWVTKSGAKNLIQPTEFCTSLRWKPAKRPLMQIQQEISSNQRSYSDTSQPKTCYRWKLSSIFNGTWSLNFYYHLFREFVKYQTAQMINANLWFTSVKSPGVYPSSNQQSLQIPN